MDEFRLVKAVDRLGESVVVGVADAADGGLDAGLGEALCVANADVLRSPDALLFVKQRCATR